MRYCLTKALIKYLEMKKSLKKKNQRNLSNQLYILFLKYSPQYMNVIPNNSEYRKYFHVDRHSFVVVLVYLRCEGFFNSCLNTGAGRTVSVSEEAILMAIISYYSTTLSLLQCSFNAGK